MATHIHTTRSSRQVLGRYFRRGGVDDFRIQNLSVEKCSVDDFRVDVFLCQRLQMAMVSSLTVSEWIGFGVEDTRVDGFGGNALRIDGPCGAGFGVDGVCVDGVCVDGLRVDGFGVNAYSVDGSNVDDFCVAGFRC